MYLNGYKPPERKIEPAAKSQASSAVNYAHKAAFSHFARNDAATQYGTLIAREATYYMPELWFKKYPEIQYRNVLPIVSQGGFSNYESLKMYDRQGRAKLASENSTVTPMVSSNVVEQVVKFYEFHLGLDWKYSELQGMEQFQPFIIQGKMDALHRGFELATNDFVLFGDSSPKVNQAGLLTHAEIARVTPAVGASGSTQWKNKTPAEIMEDIRFVYTEMNRRSKRVFNANMVYMSNTSYLQTVGNLRNAVSDLTVLEYASRFLPGLNQLVPDAFLDLQGGRVDPAFPLEDTNIAVFMDVDKSNFFVNNSIEMLPTPAVYSNYLLELPYLSRTSGFILNRSPSILILEGI